MKEQHTTKKWIFLGATLFLVLLLVIVWSVTMGSANISYLTVWKITIWKIVFSRIPGLETLFDGSWKSFEETIVWQVRLPRVFLAGLVGMALASAGVVFQGVLRNPLADPYILGVSSGSALGAALVIITGWQNSFLGAWTLPLTAFVTGMITLLIVYRLAYVGHRVKMETILLSGVVVQAFVGAALSFILSVSDERMQQIVYWLMGSLALTGWEHGWVIMPLVLTGIVIMWLFTRELNILALGEQSAYHVGVSVDRVRLVLLVMASLITGAAVSVSGTIGFVGLVVPHIVRLIVGTDHRVLLPVSALTGAILLIAADTVARTIMEPRELPIGVITAFLGAPFFAYLLRRRKRHYF